MIYPKVVFRRKQGYDYGGDHFKLEYKGYYNPNVPQYPLVPQKQNNFYQQHQEPLALFVSKPEEQTKPLFENIIVQQPQWDSFKLQNNNGGQIKQEYEAVLQKPPANFNSYQEKFPPVNTEFYPGLRQPQEPVNLFVGFDDFKQNAVQQPAEAAKQNFNVYNLPKLPQPQLCPEQQKQGNGEDLSKVCPQKEVAVGQDLFGGHFLEAQKGNFKQLFNQIPNDLGAPGFSNEFKKPNEQSIIKFSNEDAVEPQEVGKLQFGKGVTFNNDFGFGSGGGVNQGKRENVKKRRPKRVKPAPEPKYTYIIRARRYRD